MRGGFSRQKKSLSYIYLNAGYLRSDDKGNYIPSPTHKTWRVSDKQCILNSDSVRRTTHMSHLRWQEGRLTVQCAAHSGCFFLFLFDWSAHTCNAS